MYKNELKENLISLLLENLFLEGDFNKRVKHAKLTANDWISCSSEKDDLTFFYVNENTIQTGIECESTNSYIFPSSAVVKEIASLIEKITVIENKEYQDSLKSVGEIKNTPFSILKENS